MTPVDTVIHARWIIPVEPASVTLENHALAIKNGRIVGLLPSADAAARYHASHTEHLPDHALLPGLVNCHTHAAMNLMRGIADDLPLMEWLQGHIWPLEQQWMGESFVKDGTDLAIAEMLRGGTTCFNDMYFFPNITAQQALQSGIRACVGFVVIDFPSVWAESSDDYLHKGLALYDALHGQPLITSSFAPHAPYTVSDGPLQKIRGYAHGRQLPVHMHVHETLFEVEQAAQHTGKRPLQRLHELGLLSPSFIAVHMVHLTDAEIALVAQQGAHIVHCPESNLKLASGFCRVADCIAAGINVALGTDGAASNNDLDMFGEMRTAALLAKAVANDAGAVPAMTALRMATINGAKALGLDNEIGSLEVGKAADVIAIDLSVLETQPLFNPVSQIVYAASRQQVTDVWVAGQQLLNKRQLTTLDSEALKTRTANWQQRLSGVR